MMCPGANGCEATFISMKTKMANIGMEIQQQTIAKVSDQVTLLPRSRPRRRAKTAVIKVKAPRKSIFFSFSRQWESSILGRCRIK